jgi:hypothetical protein
MQTYIIGREPGQADIVITSPRGRVSRKHAVLRVMGDAQYQISDLGSSNGTEIRDGTYWRKISSEDVRPSDRIRFGGEVEVSLGDLLTQVRGGRASNDTAYGPRPGGGGGDSGIFKVVAGDILHLRGKDSVVTLVGRLLMSPISTSVAWAQDANFKAHTALLVLAIAISATYTQVLYALSGQLSPLEMVWLSLGQQHPALNVLTKVISADTFSLLLTYTFFLIAYIVNYFVFQDYSSVKQVPRNYLKLACISSFMNTLIFGAILCSAPLFAALFPKTAAAWMTIAVWIASLAAFVYYGFQTHMIFWRISGVRTFRGMVIALVLAFLVTIIFYIFLALLVIAAMQLFS